MNCAGVHHEPIAGLQRPCGLTVNQQFARSFLDITDLLAGVSVASGPRSGSNLDVRDHGFAAGDGDVRSFNYCALYPGALRQGGRRQERGSENTRLQNGFHVAFLPSPN